MAIPFPNRLEEDIRTGRVTGSPRDIRALRTSDEDKIGMARTFAQTGTGAENLDRLGMSPEYARSIASGTPTVTPMQAQTAGYQQAMERNKANEAYFKAQRAAMPQRDPYAGGMSPLASPQERRAFIENSPTADMTASQIWRMQRGWSPDSPMESPTNREATNAARVRRSRKNAPLATGGASTFVPQPLSQQDQRPFSGSSLLSFNLPSYVQPEILVSENRLKNPVREWSISKMLARIKETPEQRARRTMSFSPDMVDTPIAQDDYTSNMRWYA